MLNRLTMMSVSDVTLRSNKNALIFNFEYLIENWLNLKGRQKLFDLKKSHSTIQNN